MRRFYPIIFVFLLLGFFLSAFNANVQNWQTAEPIWLSLSDTNEEGASPHTNVSQINGNTLEVTITFPGFWAEFQTQHGQPYTRIWHDDFGSYRDPGEPALPGKTFNILVPDGVQVDIVKETLSSKRIELSQYSLPNMIIPAQIQAAKSEPAPPWTSPDPIHYGSHDLFPQTWFELKDTFRMRDYTIQPIWVNPVRYRAADGEVELLEKLELRLTWQDNQIDGVQRVVFNDSPSFDRMVSQIVINPPEPALFDRKAEKQEGYLIITPDELEPALTEFITMKEDQGFDVEVRTLSESGLTAPEIRNFIKNAYQTWPVRPTYLLLVGDTNFIPGFNTTNHNNFAMYFDKTTDLYYGTMDEDFFPDIAVGRLPVNNLSDLEIILNKIIAYNTLGFQDWHIQTSFISSCDHYTVSEGSHNHVISNFTSPLNYPAFFPTNLTTTGGDKLYCHKYSAREGNIVDSINNKRGVITYSGHGNYLSWTELDPSIYNITSSDLYTLVENQAYSFVASFACVTNDFGNSTYESVFGETWMLLENKGAVAFLGSADDTYWDPDDALERNLFEILYSEPLNPPTLRTAITGALSNTTFPTNGIASEQYYWETYNLLGDPSQKLWLYPDDQFFFIAQTLDREKSGSIGSTVEYQINLTNYGEFDTFTVQTLDNNWETNVSEVSDVLTKTTIPIKISVKIPSNAFPNQKDQVQLTITSNNSEQVYSVVLNTTAKSSFTTHIPLIFN